MQIHPFSHTCVVLSLGKPAKRFNEDGTRQLSTMHGSRSALAFSLYT